MRTREEYEKVKSLLEAGHNKCQVARLTGIPRATIKDWILLGYCPKNGGRGRNQIDDPATYLNETEERRKAYAYILGEYLGDGCVRTLRRTYRLGIYNDKKYEGLNQLIQSRLQIIFPANKTGRVSGSGATPTTGCWEICVNSNNIPLLFPQMGPGKKFERKIELTSWQLEIVDAYHKEFIRGLFYSDGCVYEHKHDGGEYSYRCYNFVNKSKDIMDYLIRSLNFVGVNKIPRWDVKRQIWILNIYSKKERDILGSFIPARHELPIN